MDNNTTMKQLIEARDKLYAYKRAQALLQYPEVQKTFKVKLWSGDANMHEIAEVPLCLRIEKDIQQYIKLQIRLLEDKIAKLEGQLKQKE